MKRIFTLFTLLLLVFSVEVFAQSPTYFNYQAVIRDNSGGLLVDRLVHVKIAIREGSTSGPVAYQEVHSVTTNTFGLVNLVIGAGAPLQGTMPTVDWGDNPHFIDIELDANNTGVYTQMGATQILSVPYALHARTVQFNDDADADPDNEIQTFVLQNNELYLDRNGNGGFMINLNPYLDNTDNQVLSVFDSTSTIRNMIISGGNKITFSVADNDNDSINEIQQVSILNDTIYLSRGGFIDLKPYLDNTDEQTLDLTNDTLVISGSNDTISLSDYRQRISLQNDTITLSGTGDTLNLVPYLDNTDEQTLTLNNDTLVISGSNDTISLADFRQRISLVNDTITLSGTGDTLNLVPYLDNTDEQTLALVNDTLVISGSNDTISLTSYLDNTDEQALSLINDTLVISGSNDTISLSNYRQTLILNGDTLSISGGNSIVLPPDSDGDSTNEVQSLSLSNDTLILSLSNDTIDLSGYLDNTDEQSLTLANDTLVISGSNDTISLIDYKQQISISNDTIYLENGGFAVIPSPAGIPDLERVGDSINVQGSFTKVSVNDNDADSTNEVQTLSFANDTLILSISNDTIDFSNYSLRIDTNTADIASLYIELDEDSAFLNDLIDSNLVLIGANQTLATGASNLANQNALSIIDLNNELDADSTNFDTLISDLTAALQMSDSMIYAKIASDSTNFDTLVSTNALDISALEVRVTNDSTNFDTLISDLETSLQNSEAMIYAKIASDSTNFDTITNNLRSDLADTSTVLRGLINSVATQALSDLEDTASALRSYSNMVSSADSNIVHNALVDSTSNIKLQTSNNLADTASALRIAIAAGLAQSNSDLADTARALRSYTNMVSSADSNIVHNALVDSTSNIKLQTSNNLADTASALRTAIASGLAQSSSDLADTASALRSVLIDSTDAIKAILAQTNTKKVNLTAIVDPASTDNLTNDYEVGSYWFNTFNGKLFFCVQSTLLEGIWYEVTNIGVEAALVNDSSVIHNALVDTAGDLRTAITTSLSQANSNLTDTASVLRGLIATSSSADSNVVHSALVDTAGDIRNTITTGLAQVNSNLSDTATVLRGLIATSSSADSNVVHSALVDTAGDIRNTITTGLAQVNSNLSDTATVLRGLIATSSSADSNVVHNALVDTAGDIRTTITTGLTQANSNLSDTSTVLRGLIATSSSADSNVVHSALNDSIADIRTTISGLNTKQNNFTAIVDPASSNNLSQGYEAGSFWLNAVTGRMFTCVSSGPLSAQWRDITNTTVQSALEDTASALRTAINSGSDDQNLTLNAGRTLSIESGNTVDLRVLSDSAINALADTATAIRASIPGASTDDQTLTLTNGRLSIENGNQVDLRVLSDSAISALNDSSQAIRNSINTVIEYVSLNCIYDSSTAGTDLPNSFYFPFSGVHALEDLQNISSSMVMPFDGEVISATVRTDQNLPFNLLKFYKNGIYTSSNIGSGLSAGVFNKSNFSGTTAQKSFSRGDLIQFRFETIAASSSQKIYILIELSYDR